MKMAAGHRHRRGRPDLSCRDRGPGARHSRRGRRDGATEKLKTATEVTVSCAEGEIGKVYRRQRAIEVIDGGPVGELRQPHTAIMVNVGNPGTGIPDGDATQRRRRPRAHGVHHQRTYRHPPDGACSSREGRLAAESEAASLELIEGLHAAPSDFFVETLSEGVGTIAAAFYPKPVIVRLSDFKTNEYASLLGGEPISSRRRRIRCSGFRGASRYAHPAYAEGFALECAALRRVREEMGLTNVRVMVPVLPARRARGDA